MGYLLIPYSIIGWVAILGNMFIDGKGGPFQKASTFVVQAALPVGAIMWVLTFIRMFTRKDCASDATSFACTYATTNDYNKWINSGYASKSRQSFLLGFSLMTTSKATTKFVIGAYEKAVKENQKAADDDAASADTDDSTADASSDASTSDASAEPAW